MSKLVILGRDGVINRFQGHAITRPEKWQAIPGSLEAIALLGQSGYRVAVATNQPGLADGLFDLDALNAIHHKLHDQLDRLGGHVDLIAFCPHAPGQGCDCRMPAPGMLQQIGERLGTALSGVPVISASPGDLGAARAVGARSMLLHDGDQPPAGSGKYELYDDLAHAVSALLVEARS